MSNYHTLKCFKHGLEFAVGCAKAAHAFPAYEQYALASQLRRAAYSVALNIAEGASRTSLVDGRRLLDIARTSLQESLVILRIALELGYVDQAAYDKLVDIGDETGRTLYGYIQSVTTKIDAMNTLRKQKAAAAATALSGALIFLSTLL